MRLLATFIFLFALSAEAAGVKVVLLGSSTAKGETGPSTIQNSWAYQFGAWLTNRNPDNIFVNLADNGTTTRNYTNALPTIISTQSPTVIVISLGNNDQNSGFALSEITNNWNLIRAGAGSTPLWVTTVLPMDGISCNTVGGYLNYITNTFPARYVDFFTGFTVAADNCNQNASYASGDGIHWNNAGHLVMFQRWTNSAFYSSLFVTVTIPTANVTTLNVGP